MQKENNKGVNYRWVVLALCFLMIFVVLGFGSSTKSTYLKAICDDLDFDRSVFSFNSSIQYIAGAVLNFFFGILLARLGARKMIALGFCSLTASFAMQAFAYEIWLFYISGALLGVGITLTSTAIVSYIIGAWFPEKKGTMIGIVLAANGIGGMVSEIVITNMVYEGNGLERIGLLTVLSESINMTGWRLASLLTAVLLVAVGVIVVVLIKPQPKKSRSEMPESDISSKNTENITADIRAVLKKPYFYLCGVSVFFVGFILQSAYTIAKSHILDVGFDAEYVVTVFSISSLLITAAKIVNGFLTDKLGVRVTYSVCCLFGAVAIGVLAFVSTDAPILAWIYSIVDPFALPLETVMIPLLVAELFRKELYTQILGYYLAVNYIGYAAGIPFVNLFYDIFGTYKGILVAYTVLLAAVFVVSLIAMKLAKQDKERTQELCKKI